MKIFGRLMLLFTIIFGTILPTITAQDNIIDRVEWVVGDKAILRSEIEEAIQYWVSYGRRFEGDPYCIVGEDLAVQKLFLHQAALDSVEVTESQILRQIDLKLEELIQRTGSKEKLEEYLNKNISQIRDMIKEQNINTQTMELMKQKIIGELKISPALVRRYINSLPEDSLPFIPTQVEVQIITREPQITIEESDRIKEEMRDYTQRINSGETSFSTLALLYSQDQGSARLGGELPFYGRGQLAPEFAAVAFNLTDPNKISKVVETEFGFHIIQLVEKRGDKIKVRHILRKPQVAQQEVQEALLTLDSISTDLKDGKFTFEEAVPIVSADKTTRNNYGLMLLSDGYSSYSKFELQDLPVEIARLVENMEVGEISIPFSMVNENGKTICGIIKLKSRITGHKANLRDDYEKLKSLYMEKLGNDKIQEWIKAKQKNTYIRINDERMNCEFKYPDWNFYTN